MGKPEKVKRKFQISTIISAEGVLLNILKIINFLWVAGIVFYSSILLAHEDSTKKTYANSRITESVVRNFQYHLLFGNQTIKLKNGQFLSTDDPQDYLIVKIVTFKVLDINHDERDDAVVVLMSSGGGSGAFLELTALIDNRKSIEQTNSFLVGDRIKLDSIKIKDSIIELHILSHETNDPSCCPSQPIIKKFAINGNHMIEINNQRGNLK